MLYTENLAAWPASSAVEIDGDGSLKTHTQALDGRPRLFYHVTVEVIAP